MLSQSVASNTSKINNYYYEFITYYILLVVHSSNVVLCFYYACPMSVFDWLIDDKTKKRTRKKSNSQERDDIIEVLAY